MNPRFIPGNAIPLGLELRVFEDQYASDWNSHAAQRRLTEGFLLNSIQENLSPGFGVNLKGYVERDHRSRRFIAVDDVRHLLAQIPMPVFQRLCPSG